MTDRDFEAEFVALVKEFDAARRRAAENERVGAPEAIARAETAKDEWRIVKERLKDLLEDWEEFGGFNRREP